MKLKMKHDYEVITGNNGKRDAQATKKRTKKTDITMSGDGSEDNGLPHGGNLPGGGGVESIAH